MQTKVVHIEDVNPTRKQCQIPSISAIVIKMTCQKLTYTSVMRVCYLILERISVTRTQVNQHITAMQAMGAQYPHQWKSSLLLDRKPYRKQV